MPNRRPLAFAGLLVKLAYERYRRSPASLLSEQVALEAWESVSTETPMRRSLPALWCFEELLLLPCRLVSAGATSWLRQQARLWILPRYYRPKRLLPACSVMSGEGERPPVPAAESAL